MTGTVYLVLEPIEIIAADLALSVQDCDASAVVIVAHSAERALDALSRQDVLRIAFLHVDPDGFDVTDLGQALAGRGATCVFMGDLAERTVALTVPVLQRPFSSETMAALLQGLSERSVSA